MKILIALALLAGTHWAPAAAQSSSAPAPAAAVVRATPMPLPTRSRFVGMNLAGIAYWTSAFPFADLMKNGSGWSSNVDGGGEKPLALQNGYPSSLLPGQHARYAVAWGGTHYPAGAYTVLWDGNGSLSFPLSNLKVRSPQPHRIVADVSDTSGQMWVSIDRTDPADPVRNIRFLLPGSETTHATQPFNVEFLKKTAPFSNLRFMDWGATNGSPVVEWADRAHVDDVTYATPKGVPIEVMVDLANTLRVDPWFCIPHQASDDYVRQFAGLVHARLDPALHPHVEYSNEMWNASFGQTKWAAARSDKLGLAKPSGMPSIFYGKRSAEIFRIVQATYGADSRRLVRVLGGQAAWTQFQESALAYGDTASQVDVLAIAPYFQAQPAGKAENVDATLKLGDEQILDQMLANIRGDVRNWMRANAALAVKYKLKLKAYESGVGDTTFYFPAGKQDAMTALFAAANRNPRMKAVYDEYFEQWIAAGGDTMNQYSDIGAWTKFGLWSALEYVTQDPATAPKYQGLLDTIARHPTAP